MEHSQFVEVISISESGPGSFCLNVRSRGRTDWKTAGAIRRVCPEVSDDVCSDGKRFILRVYNGTSWAHVLEHIIAQRVGASVRSLRRSLQPEGGFEWEITIYARGLTREAVQSAAADGTALVGRLIEMWWQREPEKNK